MKAADKWYTSNTIGNLQRVVEDENNVRIIKAKFTGAWLASLAIWRIQAERFILTMHNQQLRAIRENMETVHDICVFLLKLKGSKNESYEVEEDAELLDLDII